MGRAGAVKSKYWAGQARTIGMGDAGAREVDDGSHRDGLHGPLSEHPFRIYCTRLNRR